MLIGVLCAVVTAVAAAEKEKILVTYVKSKLMSVLLRLDEDGNGTISKEEFDQLVHIPDAVRALEELGVDVQNLVSLADHLFECDEHPHQDHGDNEDVHDLAVSGEGDEGKSMTFADFLEMVIRLRADNTPSVADIVELRKLIFKGQRKLSKHLNQIE